MVLIQSYKFSYCTTITSNNIIANIALGLSIFSGAKDEDIDSFIHLFRGYLYAIGVDPIANRDQALGIFQACFKGEAGIWYNEHILEKR